MSQSAIYINLIRPITKKINHILTGQTQIQRTSRSNDHKNLKTSIRLSKVLIEFKKDNKIGEYIPDEAIKRIIEIKNVNTNNEFYVRKMLKELYTYEYHQSMLIKLTKTKYDCSNCMHENMLLQIWKNLMPNKQLNARKSVQWIQIGFQGDDPSTDFRGMGILGLLNLYLLSTTQRGKQIFNYSIEPSSEYFFASTSIYFTMIAIQLIKNYHISFEYFSQYQLTQAIQLIHQSIFECFHQFWIKCKDKSLMNFNLKLKQFKSIIDNYTAKQINEKIKLASFIWELQNIYLAQQLINQVLKTQLKRKDVLIESEINQLTPKAMVQQIVGSQDQIKQSKQSQPDKQGNKCRFGSQNSQLQGGSQQSELERKSIKSSNKIECSEEIKKNAQNQQLNQNIPKLINNYVYAKEQKEE